MNCILCGKTIGDNDYQNPYFWVQINCHDPIPIDHPLCGQCTSVYVDNPKDDGGTIHVIFKEKEADNVP